jgi:hypothetical protein
MQVQDSVHTVDMVGMVPGAGTSQPWGTLGTPGGRFLILGCIDLRLLLGFGNEVFREDARDAEAE